MTPSWGCNDYFIITSWIRAGVCIALVVSSLSMHILVYGGIGVDLSYLSSSVKHRCQQVIWNLVGQHMTRTDYENSVCTVALILILLILFISTLYISHSPLKCRLINNFYASSNTISRNKKLCYISSYLWMQVALYSLTLKGLIEISQTEFFQCFRNTKICFVSNIAGVCSREKLTLNQHCFG